MLRLGDVLLHGWEASRQEQQLEDGAREEQARMRRLAEGHRADKERAGRVERGEARRERRAVRRFMGRDS